MDDGAGDQVIVSGYASYETADGMALTHSMATCFGKVSTEVRRSGERLWLRPCGPGLQICGPDIMSNPRPGLL
jgi:S-adenosylmethionine synthetase